MSDIMETVLSTKHVMNGLIDIIVDVAAQCDVDLDRDAARFEFQAFGIYISAADSDISSEEIEFFNILFDTSFTSQDMPELIRIVGERHKQFVRDLQMPGWALCKVLDESTGNHDVTNLYIDTMDMVMRLFALVDGNSDAKEEQFISDFASKLRMDRMK